MPARSDDPLRRVTLNLYEADCVALTNEFGFGWTTAIRGIVHNYCESLRQPPQPRTLGDLADEDNTT